jgi:Zn-finger protein
MTYGCGAEGCLTCYPYQYGCGDCGTRWDKPINNGEVYTCPECEYINNGKEEY